MEKDEIKDFGTRKTGFTIPDGYFEEFDKRMNALIDNETEKNNNEGITISFIPTEQDIDSENLAPKVSLFTKMKPWAYLAATFISFVVVFRVFLGPTITQRVNNIADSGDDIMNVEDIYYSHVSDYDMYEYLYADNEY